MVPGRDGGSQGEASSSASRGLANPSSLAGEGERRPQGEAPVSTSGGSADPYSPAGEGTPPQGASRLLSDSLVYFKMTCTKQPGTRPPPH